MLMGLHHVQLAMPEGGAAQARTFYGTVLRMLEQPRPEGQDGRSGVWFESGSLRVYLAVETPFAPAQTARPAFLVASMEVLRNRLSDHDIPCAADTPLPGLDRVVVSDPFGNRIDLLARND